jgi:hypothetical protein
MDTGINITIIRGAHRIVTTMQVDPSDTIGEVLAKVELATKVPPESQCIIFLSFQELRAGVTASPPTSARPRQELGHRQVLGHGRTWMGRSLDTGGGNIEGKGSDRGKGSGKSRSFSCWDVEGKGSGKSMEKDSDEVEGTNKGKKRTRSVAAGGGMQIMVSTGMSDDLCVVEVEEHDKIKVIKLKMLSIMGLSRLSSQKKISVSFNGTDLHDNFTLPDYNIKNEAQIHMAIGG